MLVYILCLLLTVVGRGDSCSCVALHFQDYVCGSTQGKEYGAIGTVQEEQVKGSFPGVDYLTYILKVKKVDGVDKETNNRLSGNSNTNLASISAFKGIPKGVETIYIDTNSEPAFCGLKLEVGKTYLVFGHTGLGYALNSCDIFVNLDSLTKKEKKKTLKDVKKTLKACKFGCRVKTCFDEGSPCETESPKECGWSFDIEPKRTIDGKMSIPLCKRKSRNSCQWHPQKWIK